MDFQIFVKPVGSRCNLSCDYCYYHEKGAIEPGKGDKTIRSDILESYIQQHLLAEGGETVMFSWHGGEPMLAGIGFYEDVVRIQEHYNRDGRKIINGIQTNGTLIDDEWCKFLAANNFIVGLSIDGPGHLHDLHRKTGNGKPTFDTVNNAWKKIRMYGIIHELLCVINSANVEFPSDIYNFFMEGNAEYLTFLPLVERAGSDEVNDRSVDPARFGEFMVTVFDLWKTGGIGKIKIQLFEEALRSAFGQEHTLCIFKRECGGVPAIEMDGNFYTCDHYVNRDNLVGNILESPVSSMLSSEKQTVFGQMKETSLPVYCRNCEVLGMCNGGCPRNRFGLTPSGEPGLNYLCSGYRMLFNHIKPFAETVSKAWGNRSV